MRNKLSRQIEARRVEQIERVRGSVTRTNQMWNERTEYIRSLSLSQTLSLSFSLLLSLTKTICTTVNNIFPSLLPPAARSCACACVCVCVCLCVCACVCVHVCFVWRSWCTNGKKSSHLPPSNSPMYAFASYVQTRIKKHSNSYEQNGERVVQVLAVVGGGVGGRVGGGWVWWAWLPQHLMLPPSPLPRFTWRGLSNSFLCYYSLK